MSEFSISHWNLVLFILALCSIMGFGVFFERLFFFRRSEIDIPPFLLDIRSQIEAGNIIEAIALCEQANGSVAHIIKAGLLRHHRERKEIESAMELSGKVEVAHLEKNAKILSMIAHIAPLIGLLGTVLGFIQAFGEMRMSGLVDLSATRIGEAMEYALVTTAAGLVVAIPSILGYNYLVSRVETFVLQMETTASEVVDLLMQKDNRIY